MTIDELKQEITAREKMLHNTQIIFHQLEGQISLLHDLLKKEQLKTEKMIDEVKNDNPES